MAICNVQMTNVQYLKSSVKDTNIICVHCLFAVSLPVILYKNRFKIKRKRTKALFASSVVLTPCTVVVASVVEILYLAVTPVRVAKNYRKTKKFYVALRGH